MTSQPFNFDKKASNIDQVRNSSALKVQNFVQENDEAKTNDYV